MNEIKKKNELDIVLETIWLIIVFFVPLFFLREMHNVFEIPKNIIFQTLVEILLFVYLLKIILYGSPDKGFLRQRVKYLIPGFIFIIILGVSTIFSQVPWFSFWGSWERRMGYLTWLHFFVFASILLLSLKNKQQIIRLFFSIVACSFFVSIYGLVQAVNLDPFEWTYDPFLLKRIFSAVGQPNFLGSWLLLVIPIFLILLAERNKREFGLIKKNLVFYLFSFIFLLLLFWTLFATKSRGAWVGLVALVGFLSVVFIWKKNKKFIIIPIFCLAILVGLVVFFNQSGFNKTSFSYNPLLFRLQTFTDLKEAGNYRLMHWQAAWDLIKKKPFFGYGLGSQRFNFPRYYVPAFSLYEKPNIYLDYAHNDILDVLLAAGFAGLLSYLFLVGSVFWFGLKYIFKPNQPFLVSEKNSDAKLPVLFLMAGLFGYLFSILFSFHVMSTLTYFWLFLVLITVLSRNLLDGEDKSERRVIGLTPEKSLIIILLLILLGISWWHFNARLYLSSHYFFQAQKAKSLGDWQKAIKEHQRAIKFSPNDPYFHQEFALSLYQLVDFLPVSADQSSEISLILNQKIDWLDLGIVNLKEISETERPIEAIIWLPWLESERARLTGQEEDFLQAERSFQKAADFSPQTALIYNKWCDLEIYRQQWDRAAEMCEKALLLYPDIDHPHINIEHQQCVVDEMTPVYLNLGGISQILNEMEKAVDYYRKIAYLIIKVYSPPYPTSLNYIYARMSSLYAEMGRKDLADFYAGKAQNQSGN